MHVGSAFHSNALACFMDIMYGLADWEKQRHTNTHQTKKTEQKSSHENSFIDSSNIIYTTPEESKCQMTKKRVLQKTHNI